MGWREDALTTEYDVIGVLRTTDKMSIHRLRHRRLGKDLVRLSFEGDGAVYRYLQTVSHPHLPRVYDVWEQDGRCIVLEEFVDGLTVAQVLESGTYTVQGVRRVIGAVCDAVGALHTAGLVHRDIKPENVMITTDGRVVLMDFDTVRVHKPCAARDTVVIGTAGYAAPEQFGVAQTDHRTDIFSIGIMINVMLTGAHPANRKTRGRMARVVERCTQLDPDRRYATVWDLKRALSN